jgi:diguanylate cyclase (GGDEF)-like protein
MTAADKARLEAREQAVLAREQAVALREVLSDRRDAAAAAMAQRRANSEDQLREANEHLVVATVRAQTNVEAAENATVRMAIRAERDFLTGLPNRELMNDRLVQAIALAKRHSKRVALLYMDLDNFKNVNDSLGHPVGDMLLQSTSTRLQACVRGSDTVCRHGGDEFVVLLTEVVEAQDAVLVAEKLIRAMAEPHLIGGHRLTVSLSIGICVYPEDGLDGITVLKNADIAMYHAKRSGRNNYQRFTSEMSTGLVTPRARVGSLSQPIG